MKQKGFTPVLILVVGLVSIVGSLTLGYKFVLQPYRISSQERNILLTDDAQVWAEKVSYRLGEPKVGEIVVFKNPDSTQPSTDWVGVIIEKIDTEYFIIATDNKDFAWKIPIKDVFGKVIYPSFSVDIASIKEKANKIYSDPSNVEPTPTPNTVRTLGTPTASTIPKVTPTPVGKTLKTIVVSGFAYEDRNNDGSFNSDDPKLPNMQLYVYDVASNSQVTTLFTGPSGEFSVTRDALSGIQIKPTTYNNFQPSSSAKVFTASSSSVAFAFRSGSAPSVTNTGLIEGDIFHDTNQNKTRDGGESSVYFYKLYLKDEFGNYYNTIENAQTTDTGGHFKYVNLPVGRNYTIELSNPTGDYTIYTPSTSITLSTSSANKTGIQIPVYKNY